MTSKWFIAISIILFSGFASSQTLSEEKTARYFETIKENPEKLTAFLRAMPKGADLHMHPKGSAMAEHLLQYAQNENLCIHRGTYTIVANKPCPLEDLLDNAVRDDTFFNSLIDAWSMRHFQEGAESSHDHFFAAFNKFLTIANNHLGDIFAEISQRAADQNEQYVELMVSPDGEAAATLGKQVGWDPDFNTMRSKLLAANFEDIVRDSTRNLNNLEAKKNQILECGTPNPKTGCQTTIRYLYQIYRTQPPEMVFAQFLAGFELASRDSRVVGINLVQAEDNPIAMKDYKRHMRMVAFLHELYPKVHISLHAGELNDSLVAPEGLTFHIHDAVHVAHAERIGHGVDIQEETDANLLLQDMANTHVLVEINLSSNRDILKVEGPNHPLPVYLQYGVPIALSTDDEGITRDTLTQEYKLAVMNYSFSYETLKTFVRNSIAYSFLPGQSLWENHTYLQIKSACAKDTLGAQALTNTCQAFLATNEKASMEWALESRFVDFENSTVSKGKRSFEQLN